jgi:uncharacterized protein
VPTEDQWVRMEVLVLGNSLVASEAEILARQLKMDDLISSLGLTPHPEGGHFREVFRSDARVQPLDERSDRPALTTIYFLLARGEVSRWHRVASDEAWHYYEGEPLELFVMDPAFDQLTRTVLGPRGDGLTAVHVVPQNFWQAARSTGSYTLVGCTVGPGFDFEDFSMLRDLPRKAERLAERFPDLALML